MIDVSQVILAPLVQVLLQNLHAILLSKLEESQKLKTDLRKMDNSLKYVQELLAREDENTERVDKRISWERNLRQIAYDANDVLDEIQTEDLRREHLLLHKIRDRCEHLVPSRRNFMHQIGDRVEQINAKLVQITENLRLGPVDRPRKKNDEIHVIGTTENLSVENSVFGRESVVERVVNMLLTGDGSDKPVLTIPLMGFGGIGKTTIAQVVYNHDHTSAYFEKKTWVYVPDGSNLTQLTKVIIECMDQPTTFTDLNRMQSIISDHLRGKRYLLVLDNLWNERSDDWAGIDKDWAVLQKALLTGGPGSRILVTTRNPTVARSTGTVGEPIVLTHLSDEDCWSLFSHHAFESEARDAHLVSVGKEIARKCRGWPEATRALGRHLRAADTSAWDHVHKVEIPAFIPDLQQSILNSLVSTYVQWPARLKQCIRFCGIFPPDHQFERDFLIRLWMAQGFLHSANRTPEEIGGEYIDSLLDRMFFRRVEDGSPTRYVMPSLVSQMAHYVSADESCLAAYNKEFKVPPNARHATLVFDQVHQRGGTRSFSVNDRSKTTIESFYGCEGLYTLLLLGSSPNLQIPQDMADRLKRLRALDLGCLEIKSLDESIGKLIHLRYLNISSPKIKKLPKSVSKLYNLQTLGLRNCKMLEKLPRTIVSLPKLRHIDLYHDEDFQEEAPCSLSSMPKGVGKLKLLTLSIFVLSSRFTRAQIQELGEMNDIQGDLRLLNLQNISKEASEANLHMKSHITRLELQWGDQQSLKSSDSMPEIVLEKLQAPKGIKELWVVGFDGRSFPKWIGDGSFSKLVKLRLSNCRVCPRLPPLGKLPVLEELSIKGMDAVEYVDCAFCGGSNGFHSLKKLSFERMKNWKGWYGEKECTFSSLSELVIKDCPQLVACHPIPQKARVLFIEA
ncbi:unnamed protein product [Spirodela intermedia]|uniref:Uncharacterized protein n=1 Tax=Spirodela intermedia TaxID=51605 RepID=A0A7I8JYJ9_SPIIN|nr:unnamed protein product [Spirodela intermedia]